MGALRNPKPTPSGGTIGVFAPASPFAEDRFAKGVEILQGLGFEVRVHEQSHLAKGFLAGSDQARVGALHDLLTDDGVHAVIAARGGYGVHRILTQIDFDLVARAQKPIVGFSDLTALHSAVQTHAGLVSLHGPVVTHLVDLPAAHHEALRARLLAPEAEQVIEATGPCWGDGPAEGTLTGGCLSLIAALQGTKFLFQPEDAILFLEDTGEPPYRVDRMLTHLRLTGFLDRVKAVVVGDFVTNGNPPTTVPTVIEERLAQLEIPVLTGLPCGHGPRNHVMAMGAHATVDPAKGRLIVGSAN